MNSNFSKSLKSDKFSLGAHAGAYKSSSVPTFRPDPFPLIYHGQSQLKSWSRKVGTSENLIGWSSNRAKFSSQNHSTYCFLRLTQHIASSTCRLMSKGTWNSEVWLFYCCFWVSLLIFGSQLVVFTRPSTWNILFALHIFA